MAAVTAPPLTGTELRAWRLAWGMSVRECGRRVYYGPNALRMLELGYRRVPAYVAEYVRRYPPPVADPRYPATPAGLAAAIAAGWPHPSAWATWWGCGRASAYSWLDGRVPLPVEVAGWLRMGAPVRGRVLPPLAGHAEAPARPPPAPSPRRRPGPDWVWLQGAHGWAPPPGLCRPGETYGALRGCCACAFRAECAALSGRAS